MYNTVLQGDCLIENEKIESGSVDLILTDLPYGTVTNMANSNTIKHGMKNKTSWDFAIEPTKIFNIANRILRKNGKMVLFSQQPYTTELITKQITNIPHLYNMIWEKDHFANSLIAKKAPVSYFEDVLIFNKIYDLDYTHPLREYFLKVFKFINKNKNKILLEVGQGADHCFRFNSMQFVLPTELTYNKLIKRYNINLMDDFIIYEELKKMDNQYSSTFNLWEGKKYKSNILKYKKDYNGYHPTQKPILLLEDLIKTFSNENDLVVDLTAGSGSTGVACLNTNRNYILIEKEQKYYNIINKRIAENIKQKTLF